MQLEMFKVDDRTTTVEIEEWKELKGYPRYEASTMGRIRNRGTGRLLTGQVSHNGYVHLTLMKDGKVFTQLAHRMIAKTFLEQSVGMNEVNHLNKVRTDNRVSNLEWSNRKLNQLHAHRK